jgi:hypothetical protein
MSEPRSIVARSLRRRALWITGVVVLAAAASVAGAATAKPQPLLVQSSTVTQDGLQVTWSLQMTTPFSPAALAHAGRSLCLLLQRASNGSVNGQLCVTGPAAGRKNPRIVYQRITRAGPGKDVKVAASVSRAGARTLTATFKPTSFGLAYKTIRWQVINTLRPPACTPPKPNRVG